MDFSVSLVGIILILILYLPGYFFRRFYFSGFSTKQFGLGEWYDRFFMSIFLALLIQVVTIKTLSGFDFDFESLSGSISVIYKSVVENELPSFDYATFTKAVLYLSISMCFGCVLGLFTRKLLRFSLLDIHTSTFKYVNIWHYYFKGDIIKTKEFQKAVAKKGELIFTRADILMDFEKDGEPMLYSGIVSQYDLSAKSEKLERIYLTGAKRFSKAAEQFKDIPGDILVLDASRILNINLTYDYIEKSITVKRVLLSTMLLVLALSLVFSPFLIIPYFFYTKVSIGRLIIAVFESLLFILSLMSTLGVSFTKQKEFRGKYKSSKLQALLLFFLVTVFLFIVLWVTLAKGQ